MMAACSESFVGNDEETVGQFFRPRSNIFKLQTYTAINSYSLKCTKGSDYLLLNIHENL